MRTRVNQKNNSNPFHKIIRTASAVSGVGMDLSERSRAEAASPGNDGFGMVLSERA